MTSGSWVRNRRAALFPKQEFDYQAIAPCIRNRRAALLPKQKLDYPAIAPRAFPREPRKEFNLHRDGHVVQWRHVRLMTSRSWVPNRRAALFSKQELDYPAIAPRTFLR